MVPYYRYWRVRLTQSCHLCLPSYVPTGSSDETDDRSLIDQLIELTAREGGGQPSTNPREEASTATDDEEPTAAGHESEESDGEYETEPAQSRTINEDVTDLDEESDFMLHGV